MQSQTYRMNMYVYFLSFSIICSPSEPVDPQDYYVLLDEHCTDFKNTVGGGVGWFAHIYSDYMEPGYGIYNTSGQMKFAFGPRTHC